jgi:signal transduction histidine kinase
LGLAVVRKIVDIHNGSIRIRSKAGKGTAITVTLPDDVSRKVDPTWPSEFHKSELKFE